MASSSHNSSAEYDRSRRGKGSGDVNAIIKREETCRMMQRESIERTVDNHFGEVHYMGSHEVMHNREFDHPNLFYRNPNMESPEDRHYPQIQKERAKYMEPKTSTEQLLPTDFKQDLENFFGQISKQQIEQINGLKNTIDQQREDSANKFTGIISRMDVVETNRAEILEYLQRNDVNAITLRSGRIAVPVAKREKDKETSARTVTNPDSAEPLAQTEPERDSTEEPVADPELNFEPDPAPERAYIPRVPYPPRSQTTQKTLEDAKCKKMIGDLSVKLALHDSVYMVPALKRYMKSLVTSKMTDHGDVVTRDCSAVLQNRPVQKVEDLKRGNVSFDLGGEQLTYSLGDLLRSDFKKTSKKSLFEESVVFAGTQGTCLDKPDLVDSFACQPTVAVKNANSCTGLCSVTRPPDLSPFSRSVCV